MAFTASDRTMLEGYIKKARPFEEMFSVKGKTAIVTGGSSGLGFDITLRLLQGGANVMIASFSDLERDTAMPLLEEQGFTLDVDTFEAMVNAEIQEMLIKV